jgi:hypothetical protein
LTKKLTDKFKDGDLRTIKGVDSIIKQIKTAKDFDNLFKGLFDANRHIVMRSADAIEKITLTHRQYLQKHKNELLKLCNDVEHIELKWHLAQLIARLKLNEDEIGFVWDILTRWALYKKESKIVRVFSLQGLFDLLEQAPELRTDYEQTLATLEGEPIPSIAARIRILRKKLPNHK